MFWHMLIVHRVILFTGIDFVDIMHIDGYIYIYIYIYILREKSLAIYFGDSQLRRNMTFNVKVLKIC